MANKYSKYGNIVKILRVTIAVTAFQKGRKGEKKWINLETNDLIVTDLTRIVYIIFFFKKRNKKNHLVRLFRFYFLV